MVDSDEPEPTRGGPVKIRLISGAIAALMAVIALAPTSVATEEISAATVSVTNDTHAWD